MARTKLLVNLYAALSVLGAVLKWMGLTFILPLGVALYFNEPLAPFLFSLVIVVGSGWILELLSGSDKTIGPREGFLVVSLTWLAISLGGSLPYIFTGSLGFIDALFESMSGFTTTGGTVFADIAQHTTSLLFWRSLSQWLGGMGIIVLAVAILPRLAIGGRHILLVERSDQKLRSLNPHIRSTAQQLWLVYLILTLAEIALLVVTGVLPLDAIVHSFTTIATGGFSPYNNSIEALPAISHWVFILFMFLGGLNFVLIYKAMQGQLMELFRDAEFKFYVGVVAFASILLAIDISTIYTNLEEIVRDSLFQVISIITTTGFANADFNQWDPSAKLLILMLMFIGGSAGSTTGAFKILRMMIIFKVIGRELQRAVQSRRIIPIRLGGSPIDDDDVKGVLAFLAVYLVVFAIGSLLLMLDLERVGAITSDNIQAIDILSATASSLGNVGPGFGLFGPMSSYAFLPDTSKVLLILLMWMGRLEILPVVVIFLKSFWKSA